MKKKLTAILPLILILSLAACGSSPSSDGTSAESSSAGSVSAKSVSSESVAAESAADSTAAGTHHAEIVIRDYGTVTVELDGDAAPITVENFIGLANDKFYDGLTFHRIIDGFMIQGGDPNGNGTGGSDKTIKGEFSENGVENPISHEPGVISMARSQDPDSASSQFFITVGDATYLDGQYAAFGHVTEGMEVVEKIAKDAEPTDGNGTIPPEAQPVIETIRILD